MFTGIVQAVAIIQNIDDHDHIRTFTIEFPAGFCQDLAIGASVAIDGVCLTVTELVNGTQVKFDVILQSLNVTTLANFEIGAVVNAERAAKDGAEIGGHPLSGHVDFRAQIIAIEQIDANCRMRIGYTGDWGKYIFAKGYIAINGCSLTLAEVNKTDRHFEVWLIPETRRATTFSNKLKGDWVNIEIERGTQVIVDTIQNTLEEKLGELYPLLEKLLIAQNIELSQGVSLNLAKVSALNDHMLKDS